MACADIPMDILGEQNDNRGDQKGPVIQHYKPTKLVPCSKGPLHDLLQKQPAVLGSLQLINGLMSFGVGVLFAVTQGVTQSLLALFRVPLLTGSLFLISGLLSNLLFKFPRLLPVCMFANIGSLTVAAVGCVLICTDFFVSALQGEFLKMEVLMLCVLVMEIIISAVLTKWIYVEQRSHSK
ncbi:B-lymphocyte antigen CD20 isoform X2 [Hypomesus transpacificus]|nr:B-lymphocyte antigen CD20 isoform X2 [Hypomesus transpacificus]XP_046900180.1 B-lymphocyte antigen CD20 isoform X2 [Hypomesus transpacificus]XP_046900186.1 B-lymphocyte antigen CD20 isoform X2 [Hypomesus transpacificus]XP_046900195.1 B-lymphocyte antigen CD20 isoform X2 [Hypomesus transpacificus]XP_046900203.1 B-lymphocyte antigen CD20 isoform X2 [Hypomesus transpacificus]XP_046900210.1 B-lymphocyte antigen CD20 isoform X2 [Hypomesus transpacificus]